MSKSSCLLCLSFSILTTPLALAQEDVYWIANRFTNDVQKISAWGEVLFTKNLGVSLRAAYVAPDGKVWVQKYITTSFIVMSADGATVRDISANGGAYPGHILFDKTGQALVLVTGRSSTPKGVQVYDKNGNYVKTYSDSPILTTPLSHTMDSDGNVWIAYRAGPPSSIAKLDLSTGQVTEFPMPTTTLTLGGNITADYRGLFQKSHLWVVGDSAPELVEFDTTGKVIKVHMPDATGKAYGSLAIDAQRNIWLTDYSGGKVIHFDTTSGTTKQTLSVTTPIGVVADGRGRILVTSRLANASSPPSKLLRFDPSTYNLEQSTTVGGGPSRPASSNFQFSLVVDPLGDADGDGNANFSEITAGTSAYDSQSNGDTDIMWTGIQTQNNSIKLAISGKTGAASLLFISLKSVSPPICIPGWKGCILIDPTPGVMFPFPLSYTVPGTLTLGIPGNPALVGLKAYFQGAYDLAGVVTLSNLDGVQIWN